MSAFVLVHGAYHGGWCWQLLGDELDALGFRWVAPDLPCDDVNAGVSEYADAVDAAIDEAGLDDGEDLVVVGHSLGGLTAPVVAARRSARQLVYLAALVPEPGVAPAAATHRPVLSEYWEEFSARTTDADGLNQWQRDDAIEIFFHDCDPQVAAWAAGLLRPQAYTLLGQPIPLEAMPQAECRYVACAEDRTMAFSWQLEAARRLGVEAVVMPGGHSPFLSRPKDLAASLTAGLTPGAR